MNPLIRKTLTSIVPLHFGGKNISLIHPPRSNRRRAELRGALLGIRLCGGGGFRQTREVLRVRM